MTNPDLTYTAYGAFVRFFAETPAGEDAWRAIADQTDGTGAIFPQHLASTLYQLRRAGYTVRKAKKVTESNDQLLRELFSA